MYPLINGAIQIYRKPLNKKYSIKQFIFFVLLIIIYPSFINAQIDKDKPKNRIVKVDNMLEDIVEYSCRDSIYSDMDSSLVTLFGEAKVLYDGITMTADKIVFDIEKSEVYCIYTVDEEGERIGIPKFEEGTESFTAASIRYNFETKKGYIEELKTEQEELYLQMGTAKRQANEHIHFVDGKITTCDLDDPHFHFNLSKAVMVPQKRIATGPMNLWVKGIPTPIGLPFSSLPMQGEEKETGGLLFPQMAPASPFGMGFQDLGYYFPIKQSDQIHTTLYGSLYSQGTFEVRNETEYLKRYKYQGRVNLQYSSFRRPFPADTIRQEKIVIQWNHQQEPKANPYWRFNSSVNFQSDNDGQTNLDPLSDQYFQNNFNSDINLTRMFPSLPITMGLKAGLKQNSASGNLDLDLPTYTLNANRFFPFKALRTDQVGKEKWYEKIGMTYDLEAKNRAVFRDDLLDKGEYDLIRQQFQNGARHSARLITALPLFNQTITLSPSVNYNLRMNTQEIRKSFDEVSQVQMTDTLRQFGLSHDLSMNLDFSTNLYAYYRFIWDPDLKMRHVITPTIVFQVGPNMTSHITDNVGPTGQEITYSPYQNSLYREPAPNEVGRIRYNINNTFELKRRAKNDTLEDFERIRIIEALTISGVYDHFVDSLNFSPVKLQGRTSPKPGFSIVAGANFSMYGWNPSTGRDVAEFAKDIGQGLGRFTRSNLNVTYTFASKESKEKIEKNQQDFSTHWEADFQYFAMNPHEIIDFDIPWKVNLSYNLLFDLNSGEQYAKRRYRETQNITVSGDVTLTKRWKLAVNSNYDVTSHKMTQTRISLDRDMHCWQLSFNWTPVSGQQSFLVRFNAKSSLFEAAQIELRKPPEFL